MAFLSDLKVLYHLALSPVRGRTHAERLESFYRGQAGQYDDFRRRLLKGREALYQSLSPADGDVWVDMGGGTGANLEFIADKVPSLKNVYLVDLSPSLLQIARERSRARHWTNIKCVEEDVTRFVPEEGFADIVTFSYSLTMIPDWFRAIDQARRILKPGGRIGVVDFYVPRKHPAKGWRRASALTRGFWPAWFAIDNVHPSPDHAPYLHSLFEPLHFSEHTAPVPYMLGLRTPYYRFIGRRGPDPQTMEESRN